MIRHVTCFAGTRNETRKACSSEHERIIEGVNENSDEETER